jgi:hypothetical protein
MEETKTTSALTDLLACPENSLCADCDEPEPTWASISHGSFICGNCVKQHLRIDNLIVKNVQNDKFEDFFIRILQLGGNMRLK